MPNLDCPRFDYLFLDAFVSGSRSRSSCVLYTVMGLHSKRQKRRLSSPGQLVKYQPRAQQGKFFGMSYQIVVLDSAQIPRNVLNGFQKRIKLQVLEFIFIRYG